MLNREIQLTQAMTDRINAILAQTATDPAYFPGQDILVGHEELIQNYLTFDLTYQVKNLAADDTTGQNYIEFQIFNYSGKEVHRSSQEINSLEDSFTVEGCDGVVSAVISFVTEPAVWIDLEAVAAMVPGN